MEDYKSLLNSKTMLTALLALASKAFATKYGFEVPHDLEFYTLIAAMCGLRLVTKQAIKLPWRK